MRTVCIERWTRYCPTRKRSRAPEGEARQTIRPGLQLLLYDITSAYFEGQAGGNPQAQRGYSRDHRPDCKQVNITLVVSRCGMPLGYEVFADNRHDATTLWTH
jgi:hypothetical protein